MNKTGANAILTGNYLVAYEGEFMKDLFIGLDFGSDSVRALLVDECGNQLAESVHNYSRWSKGLYCDASRGQFRQHPLDYLEGMEKVVSGVLKNQDASLVKGIALDTTGSTPCAVDRNGTPLALLPEFADDPDAMFVLWKDHTALEEEKRINEVAGNWQEIDYRKYEGGIYSCEWFWSKYLHILRHSDAVRNAAFSFVEHCDWINGVLCGNYDPLTIMRNRCAAGHKAMWHEEWGGLPPEEFFTAIDPLLSGKRENLYRETFTVDIPRGRIAPEYAAKFGLPETVIIGGCALDCHMGAIGAGIAPGVMVKVLGTSTCDILVQETLDHSLPGICGQINGSVLPGMVGLESGQSAFGDVYAWFKRFLSYSAEVSLEKLESEAAMLAPGAGGVTALDWFNGRRTPYANPFLPGALTGLNLGTTPAMVYRALIEATLFGSKAILAHYINEGLTVDAVTAVGGISQKSSFIMQMCADVLNIPIRVSKSTQACALGAAMSAAVASGTYPDLVTAGKMMGAGFSSVYEPQPEKVKVYSELFHRYISFGKSVENLNF